MCVCVIGCGCQWTLVVCEASEAMCVVQCDSVHKVKMRMVQCRH